MSRTVPMCVVAVLSGLMCVSVWQGPAAAQEKALVLKIFRGKMPEGSP